MILIIFPQHQQLLVLSIPSCSDRKDFDIMMMIECPVHIVFQQDLRHTVERIQCGGVLGIPQKNDHQVIVGILDFPPAKTQLIGLQIPALIQTSRYNGRRLSNQLQIPFCKQER
jgi:hypothetical protein